MESSSDHHEGGVLGFGLVGGSRVSRAGKGIAIGSDEGVSRVLENGVNDGGIDMRLNGEVSGSGIVDGENIGANLVERRLDRNVSEVGELHAIDLVVDLRHCSRKGFDHNSTKMNAGLGSNGVESNEKQETEVEFTEKEGEYEVGDLVWGKVKSHPWWPGLIFDPPASTDEARKYFKKDCFLIAYYGDQTFTWNDSSNIKPFRTNFCKMVKQSINAEAFCGAVDHALHEAGRRVEFGLLCSCLSEEATGDIKSHVVVNAGIRKESSRIDGGDRLSTVASFKPAKVVQCVQDLAKDPFGTSRLQVSTAKAQLLAFNRWKGYHQLPLNQILDGLDSGFVDGNSGLDSMREVTKEGKLNARGRVPQKRKQLFDGGLSPSKKVRCLSDLMSNGGSSVSDGKSKTRKRGRKRKGSREGIQSLTADEFLLQICLAARNPMEEQHSHKSLVRFSSDFRNYRLETKSESGEDENGVEQSKEATEVAGFTGIKDSYWTDRIIEINPDEHVFSDAKSLIADISPKHNQEESATALILKFSSLDSVPSVTNLNEIFSRFGRLREPETRVLKKNNCVKVVFERRSDAEAAFSSSGKFSIFGPALLSYRLDYSPTPRKTPTVGRKQNKEGMKSAKGMQFENQGI